MCRWRQNHKTPQKQQTASVADSGNTCRFQFKFSSLVSITVTIRSILLMSLFAVSFHAFICLVILISNVSSITEVRSASARLFAGKWRPLFSVITTLYYVAIIFHRRVWYRTCSLCYACISNSGIIFTPGYLCAKFCFFRGLHF